MNAESTGRGQLAPRDVKNAEVAFARLRREGIVTRTFSEQEIEHVRKYLLHWGMEDTWRKIAAGDLGGYSILVHETTELDYFHRIEADPFDFRDFAMHYHPAHARALVEEHELHQRLAREYLDYDLNIATLVARNALVTERTRQSDLDILKAFTDHKSVREKDIPRADEYFRKLIEGELP